MSALAVVLDRKWLIHLTVAGVVAALFSVAASCSSGDEDFYEAFAHIPFEDVFDVFNDQVQPFIPNYPNNLAYGVVIDCVPYATRVHIFNWTELDDNGQPQFTETLKRNFPSGLDELSTKSSVEVEDYVDRILAFIDTFVPTKMLVRTAVTVVASESSNVTFVKHVSDLMSGHHDFSQVLVGSQEQFYNVITLKEMATGAKPPAYGVLEMGKDSVRLTHQLTNDASRDVVSQLSSGQARNAHAGGKRHADSFNWILHTVTFEGLGSENARNAQVDLLVYEKRIRGPLSRIVCKAKCLKRLMKSFVKVEVNDIIGDPCAPQDYAYVLSGNSTQMPSHSKRLLSHEYSRDLSATQKFLGTGSYKNCRRLAQEILELAKAETAVCEDARSCPLNLLGEDFVPYETLGLLGTREIPSVVEQLTGQSETIFNLTLISAETQAICETPDMALTSSCKGQLSCETARRELCFKAVWLETFLVDGLKMPDDYDGLKTYTQAAGNENIHDNIRLARKLWLTTSATTDNSVFLVD